MPLNLWKTGVGAIHERKASNWQKQRKIDRKWSRTRRSTKLSHSPKWNTHSGVRGQCATYFAYLGADSKEIESVSKLR